MADRIIIHMPCMTTASPCLRHDRLFHSAAPGDLHRLSQDHFDAYQHGMGRFVEHRPASSRRRRGYSATPIDLARLTLWST